MQLRRQCGENITAKSPLFRREFNREDIFQVANDVRRLTLYAVRKTITKLVYESGLRKPLIFEENSNSKVRNNRRETALTHGFRKFFGTWARHAGLSDSYVEWLSGRELGGSKDSYFLPQPDSAGIYRDMLEGHDKGRGPGYLDAIDWLTIDDSKRLQRENQMLKVKKSEYELLKEQVEENKRSQLGLMEWVKGLRKDLGIPAEKAMVWDMTKAEQGQISFCEEEEYNNKHYGKRKKG